MSRDSLEMSQFNLYRSLYWPPQNVSVYIHNKLSRVPIQYAFDIRPSKSGGESSATSEQSTDLSAPTDRQVMVTLPQATRPPAESARANLTRRGQAVHDRAGGKGGTPVEKPIDRIDVLLIRCLERARCESSD
jgi:hypothetical protein